MLKLNLCLQIVNIPLYWIFLYTLFHYQPWCFNGLGCRDGERGSFFVDFLPRNFIEPYVPWPLVWDAILQPLKFGSCHHRKDSSHRVTQPHSYKMNYKLPHLLTYTEKYICQEDRWWRYASSGQNVPFSVRKLTRSQIITRRWLNDHAIRTRKVHSMFNGIKPYPEIAVFTLYIISVTEIVSLCQDLLSSGKILIWLELCLHPFFWMTQSIPSFGLVLLCS